MIILEQYGISLRRITEEDIELIRIKRNDPAIRKEWHIARRFHLQSK